MLVDNAVVVVESIYQEREKHARPAARWPRSWARAHVAIALSAGTLCHCIVFLPNLFGERNFLSIYLSQIAITISVVAAGVVAGRGEPDPDDLGAHEDAAGGAQRRAA